jgi:hypothetical protein
MELYSDNKPETTLSNTGYKNKEVAKKTISIIKHRSIIYQKSVIITMKYQQRFPCNEDLTLGLLLLSTG